MTKPDVLQTKENSDTVKPVKVFISYSHDNTEHSKKVLEFSNKLRKQGLDCNIDQYEESPPEGWPRWMDKQIDTSNYTIIICTKRYYEKVKTLDNSDYGKGVKWESLLLYSQLYHNGSMNYNFIPVIFENDSTKYIPEPLRDSTHYNMEKDFMKLTNRLRGKSNIIKPNLGESNQEPSQNNNKTIKPKRLPIRLEIDEKFEDYNQDQKAALVNSISEFLKAGYSIEIDKIERGSVLLYLKLTESDIEKLKEGIENGLFDSHKVRKIEVLDQFNQDENSKSVNIVSQDQINQCYETVFIITPVLSESQLKDVVENVKNNLIKQGAKITHEENWGLKKLAYPIQKKSTGIYYLIEFKGNSTIEKQLEIQYRRDERIIRFLTFKMDKYAVEYTEKKRKASLSKHKMGYD